MLIHAIYPRQNTIERQAVGKHGEIQIIAANVDYAFIIQAVDRDFNLNRLERYLSICNASRIKPIVILNKSDLIEKSVLDEMIQKVKGRVHDLPVIGISNVTLGGYEQLRELIKLGQTYCLLGSSGVGKSTLINNLTGKETMQTGAISESNKKGQHVTTHRQMIILPQGGVFIDNPGMREVGVTQSEGIEDTFTNIVDLADNCRYDDCTHTTEKGCAVIEAVANGEIDEAAYQNYLKMMKEKAHFEQSVAEKRQKDKAFGKMLKNFKKDMQ